MRVSEESEGFLEKMKARNIISFTVIVALVAAFFSCLAVGQMQLAHEALGALIAVSSAVATYYFSRPEEQGGGRE